MSAGRAIGMCMAYIELVGILAQGGIVLLDKVPADFILGDLRGSCLLCGLAGGWLLRGCEVGGAGGVAVLIRLWRVVAVDGTG